MAGAKPIGRRRSIRSEKPAGRRQISRAKSPQRIITSASAAERKARALMRNFNTLKAKLGVKNVSSANLARLEKSWKVKNPAKARQLKKLKGLKADYSGALRKAAWSRKSMRLGLVRDPKFTQIGNLAAFTHKAFGIIRAAKRQGKGCSMAMFDLDRFKAINDSFGHAAGDVVIGEAASMLANFAERHGGAAARVGGEEFRVFVAMPAKQLAKELRTLQNEFSSRLSNMANFGVSPIKSWRGWKTPTFSAGVSGASAKVLRGRADKVVNSLAHKSDDALYKAKVKRNSVELSR